MPEAKQDKRLLIPKEIDCYAGAYGNYWDIDGLLKAQDAKTLKKVGEWLEAKLMLKSGVVISGKTLTEVITRLAEALKRGEMADE